MAEPRDRDHEATPQQGDEDPAPHRPQREQPRDAVPNAGYTGGLAEGAQDAVGMRQIVVDEAAGARRKGEDVEPASNLGQQDQ